jgi:hypothetical protein
MRGRCRLVLVALAALVVSATTGCGDSSSGGAQPKLQGPPDPRVKGPAPVGGEAAPKAKSVR